MNYPIIICAAGCLVQVALFGFGLRLSRRSGSTGTAVLHDVGDALDSVETSVSRVADQVCESRICDIARAARLARQEREELGDYLGNQTQGWQLPEYLASLASHLRAEQILTLKEIDFLRAKIGRIKQLLAAPQHDAKVAGLVENVRVDESVADALPILPVDLAAKESGGAPLIQGQDPGQRARFALEIPVMRASKTLDS